jgi:broad specificity phosphatase PhoE
MKIIFIRHSKTQQEPNIPIVLWNLTEEGIDRAYDLSNNKDIKDIDIIYTSLQTKALETTLILASKNIIPVKTDNRLTEITSFTLKFTSGKTEYEKKQEAMYSGKVQRMDGGESFEDALGRFNTALEEIVKNENKFQNIGIVSHGNMLATFTASYLDMPAKEIQSKIKMPDYAIFDWDKKRFLKLFTNLN